VAVHDDPELADKRRRRGGGGGRGPAGRAGARGGGRGGGRVVQGMAGHVWEGERQDTYVIGGEGRGKAGHVRVSIDL